MNFLAAGVDDWFPLVLGSLFLSTPLVWMFLSHQRRMAELLHSKLDPNQNNQEIHMLRGEVLSLRQQVQDLTIALDSVNQRLALPPKQSQEL